MFSVRGCLFVVFAVLTSAVPAQAGRLQTTGPIDWKHVVTPADMDRIKAWRAAFVKALDNSKVRGNASRIASEGALLDPDSAMGGPGPKPGRYRCRVIKLGAKTPSMPAFTVYPDFACVVADEGEVLSFAKIGGSQRPVGLIFPGDDRRQIFLGTMMLGDETRPMDYGRDALRDMAGAIERIGPDRWRLILPYPHFESVMDVIELVPQA